MEQDRMILGTLGHLMPFTPLITKKNQNFEQKKKNCWRYHRFTQVYQNSYSRNIWLLRYRVRPTEVFVLLAPFLPFYSPNNQEKQIFEKNETSTCRDVILVHVLTKNGSHMMYGS